MKIRLGPRPLILCGLIGIGAVFGLTEASAEENAAASANPAGTNKSALVRFAEQDYLLGTWGGLRTTLSKHGVDFEFFYIASNPHNIMGGIQTGSTYQGALLMLMDLDSQKLVGYEGGRFHVSGVWLSGQERFSDVHIGDLNKVNLVDFPLRARLWELYYEQKLWKDRFTVKLGQLAVDQDFIAAEFYNSLASITLLNQTFFYPTLAFNVYKLPGIPGPQHALASSPYGAPGIVLKAQATEKIYAQFGAYDGYPDQTDGTQVTLNSEEGVLLYAETGYRLNQGKDDTGLPGNIKLGGFYHSSDFADNLSLFRAQVGAGPVLFHPNTFGGYLLWDQTLFREQGKDDPAHQGLVGFFRTEGAPSDRNLTQFGLDGGLVYKGLIPTRDYDTLALAASYLQMSSDIRQGQHYINSLAPGTYTQFADYEGAIEVDYKAQLTAWWTLQFAVERVLHPGGHIQAGNGNPPDAWAFIIASTLRF